MSSINIQQNLKHLAAPDSVMEPKVQDWIKECLSAGKPPKDLLELLSENYTGFAQMANLLYDWHMFLGDEEIAIDREVRLHLKVQPVCSSLPYRSFDLFVVFIPAFATGADNKGL
jgi:hypothetical protein